MHLDFLSKALDTARQVRQNVNDAVAKSSEQAQPLIADAVARARQAIHVTAKAVSEATAPKPPTPPGAG